jgi:RNA polymerase sigma factor (sigma-70 family)
LLALYKSDQVILDCIAKGDDTALSSLFRSNLKMIVRYITTNHGTQKDAEEQLQDALVILWEKIRFGNFTLNSKLSTYLFAVVKNRWRKELHRKKKFINLDSTLESRDPSPLISDTLQETDLTNLVKASMEHLSPLCREILKLFYYEDKTMREISSIVGLANEKTAKAKKYQCKKELEFIMRSSLNEQEIFVM